jgi:hypothetical protein
MGLHFQLGWEFCGQCSAIFFARNEGGRAGRCALPPGQPHLGQGIPLKLLFAGSDVGAAPSQDNWRWCAKCEGLFFHGNPTDGLCPAGGRHVVTKDSGNYLMVFADGSIPSKRFPASHFFRWCNRCEVMFHITSLTNLFHLPDPRTMGICPKDGNVHSFTGSGFYHILEV